MADAAPAGTSTDGTSTDGTSTDGTSTDGTSTDQRLAELHERLVTWWFGSSREGSELQGIWDDAFRRFDGRLRRTLAEHPTEEERLMDTPNDMILECFEASLADHDHILATFPHELPDGWIEWLPLPPEE